MPIARALRGLTEQIGAHQDRLNRLAEKRMDIEYQNRQLDRQERNDMLAQRSRNLLDAERRMRLDELDRVKTERELIENAPFSMRLGKTNSIPEAEFQAKRIMAGNEALSTALGYGVHFDPMSGNVLRNDTGQVLPNKIVVPHMKAIQGVTVLNSSPRRLLEDRIAAGGLPESRMKVYKARLKKYEDNPISMLERELLNKKKHFAQLAPYLEKNPVLLKQAQEGIAQTQKDLNFLKEEKATLDTEKRAKQIRIDTENRMKQAKIDTENRIKQREIERETRAEKRASDVRNQNLTDIQSVKQLNDGSYVTITRGGAVKPLLDSEGKPMKGRIDFRQRNAIDKINKRYILGQYGLIESDGLISGNPLSKEKALQLQQEADSLGLVVAFNNTEDGYIVSSVESRPVGVNTQGTPSNNIDSNNADLMTGTAPDGKRVKRLPNGKIIDEDGNERDKDGNIINKNDNERNKYSNERNKDKKIMTKQFLGFYDNGKMLVYDPVTEKTGYYNSQTNQFIPVNLSKRQLKIYK